MKKILCGMVNVLEEYTLNHYAEVRKLKELMQKTEGVAEDFNERQRPDGFCCLRNIQRSKASMSAA